ncbi:hypothetical protein ABIF90_008119 [Bradyrhizobium japonicum]
MDAQYLAFQLYFMCAESARTHCLAEDDWLRFKLEHHMEPSLCEAALVLTIRRLCSALTDLQLEMDRLRELRRPTTAQDIRDVLLKERARTGATLDNVISDLVQTHFGDVPFDVVQRGISLAKCGKPLNGNRQAAYDDDRPF